MVVSPFVGVRSQSERSTKTQLSDISSSLLENKFFQNQILRQGTSLAGPTLIAAGSAMEKAGDAPRTSFRSHLKARDTTGKKAFKPYYSHGRYYNKPLGKHDYGRGGKAHGYQTDYRAKSGIKRNPVKSKTGRVVKGLGRGSAGLGIALVGYNVYRHGAKKTAEDEVKFNYSISPLGVIDQQIFDGGISSNRYLNSAPGRTVSAVAQMAILEALL